MKYTLLIVDDEQAILTSLKKYFSRREELEVITTPSPLEAIKIIEERKIHIVLLDIQMPEMDGLSLIPLLKKRDPLIQVIIMTAYTSIERTIKALELGANDYVVKPFESLEELWKIIEFSIEKLERWRKTLLKNL